MTSKDITRITVIKNLVNKLISTNQAEKQLILSWRQVQRLKTQYLKYGEQGLIHGNRGKESNNKLSEEKIKEIEKIIKEKYFDFGPQFAKEKLEENNQITIGKETLRQLMIKAHIWYPKPRKENKEHRYWRPRKEHYGEMIQFDGSYHHWFENRANKCCLKELRLANISNIAEANEFVEEIFLKKFNEKFSVVPTNSGDVHRNLNDFEKQNLNKIFSIQDCRIVNNDFTIRYENAWFQLLKDQPYLVLRKEKVLVEKRLDGNIFISLRNKYLNFKVLPERPKKVCEIMECTSFLGHTF